MRTAIQTNYSEPKAGVPGGFVDRALYGAVTRCNGEDTGKMFFGLGVVKGDTPGTNVILPTGSTVAADFEGVVLYSANVEMDLDGVVRLESGRPLDILQHGKVWVQVSDDAVPAYGATAYLITSGDEAGRFTHEAGSGSPSTVAIKARFLGAAEEGIAPAQFYDMPQ